MNLAPKTVVGTGGSALGAAVVGIALYFTKQNPPPDVVAAMCLVVSSVFAFVGSYIAPHETPNPNPPSN